MMSILVVTAAAHKIDLTEGSSGAYALTLAS